MPFHVLARRYGRLKVLGSEVATYKVLYYEWVLWVLPRPAVAEDSSLEFNSTVAELQLSSKGVLFRGEAKGLPCGREVCLRHGEEVHRRCVSMKSSWG